MKVTILIVMGEFFLHCAEDVKMTSFTWN